MRETIQHTLYRFVQACMAAWTVWVIVDLNNTVRAVERLTEATDAPIFQGQDPLGTVAFAVFVLYWAPGFAALGVLALMVKPKERS
mgnify:CR=1 FL=1